MGVSKTNGTPKWMMKIMENPIKMDDLGVALFLETPIYRHVRGMFVHTPSYQYVVTEEFWLVNNLKSSGWDWNIYPHVTIRLS